MPKLKQDTKKRYAARVRSPLVGLAVDHSLPTQAWYNQKGAHIFGALYLTLVWVSVVPLARIRGGGDT